MEREKSPPKKAFLLNGGTDGLVSYTHINLSSNPLCVEDDVIPTENMGMRRGHQWGDSFGPFEIFRGEPWATAG